MNNTNVSSIASRWNAGETGCGRLIADLRRELAKLNPGDLIEIIAHDVGARADLPAWCRMTGHCLVSAVHSTYIIKKRAA
jgi:tRNA 2-thiouridine synthesizing protein A